MKDYYAEYLKKYETKAIDNNSIDTFLECVESDGSALSLPISCPQCNFKLQSKFQSADWIFKKNEDYYFCKRCSYILKESDCFPSVIE
jgi:hypothetical protein